MARLREAAMVEAAIEGYHNAKDKPAWSAENPELFVLYTRLNNLRRTT
jgi:hypothetical protein